MYLSFDRCLSVKRRAVYSFYPKVRETLRAIYSRKVGFVTVVIGLQRGCKLCTSTTFYPAQGANVPRSRKYNDLAAVIRRVGNVESNAGVIRQYLYRVRCRIWNISKERRRNVSGNR